MRLSALEALPRGGGRRGEAVVGCGCLAGIPEALPSGGWTRVGAGRVLDAQETRPGLVWNSARSGGALPMDDCGTGDHATGLSGWKTGVLSRSCVFKASRSSGVPMAMEAPASVASSVSRTEPGQSRRKQRRSWGWMHPKMREHPWRIRRRNP